MKQQLQGRWSEEEHVKFLTGLYVRPRLSWTQIAALVETRTPRQIRTHAQKYFQKVKKQQLKHAPLVMETTEPFYPVTTIAFVDDEIIELLADL